MLMKFDDIPVVLSLERALKILKLDEDFAEDIAPLVEQSIPVAKPKVLVRIAEVSNAREDAIDIGGHTIHSRIVARNLAHCQQAFLFVATCGVELDELMTGRTDAVEQFWQAQINQDVMAQARRYAQEQLQEKFSLPAMNSVNPGSNPDWPISAQVELFAMIGNVKEEIGVTLTDSFLMLPIKSTSGILYVGKDHYTNCCICLRKNCEGRRAPFDQAKYDEIFAHGDQADA